MSIDPIAREIEQFRAQSRAKSTVRSTTVTLD